MPVFTTFPVPQNGTMERQDYERKRARQQGMARTIYDFGMGILWTGVGVVMLFHQKFGININFDNLLANIFGGSAVLYGLFRIYRGYKSFQQGS